ncbi:hypothetical protein EVAR_25268_1 [Eumeta japonica]|uniref:Uncharacterized protein n=1 Tax=Eumeta variegata TaxID=151549 RepID=A0A4C1VMS4_EUMVA|nr:hypothetical protein EVAR_25268_1 [Eumeta japonica]
MENRPKVGIECGAKIRIKSVIRIGIKSGIEIKIEVEIESGTRIGIYLDRDRVRNQKRDRDQNEELDKLSLSAEPHYILTPTLYRVSYEAGGCAGDAVSCQPAPFAREHRLLKYLLAHRGARVTAHSLKSSSLTLEFLRSLTGLCSNENMRRACERERGTSNLSSTPSADTSE